MVGTKTYYQVVARENGKLVIVQDYIENYQDAVSIADEFALIIPFVDGNFSDVQVYTIHM